MHPDDLPTTLGHMLRRAAELWPDRPAVVFEGTGISFRAFDEQVDVWARAMIAAGIRRGENIAVLAPNRPEWLLTSFAAARIGAVVTALNTWHKSEELASAIDRSRSVAVFAWDRLRRQDFVQMLDGILPERRTVRLVVGLAERAPEGATALARFLEAGRQVSEDELRSREKQVRGEDDLFILFTSGSTAQPKGVVTRHDHTVRNDYWIGERQGLNESDALWLVVPLFYGFAAANALAACWTHGTALILEESFEPQQALDTMERTQATVYYGLGNMTRALVAAQRERPRRLALRKGLTGYSEEDKRLAIEDLGVSELCGIYGLTECHGLCAMSSASDEATLRLAIDGYALPGWEMRVVDPVSEDEVEPGAVGHLLVRGMLSRGYLDQPEETAAVFTPEGFFRTGDLVSIDERGHLHYRSRLKDLIKVGGVSVSPREVESVVQAHPAVRQAFVVGVPDTAKGEAVVAIVERFPGKPVEADEIVAFVRERSALYNAPSRVVFLSDDEIPKLASGKADLRSLRDLVLEQAEVAS